MKKKSIIHSSCIRKEVNVMLLKMKLLAVLIFCGAMALSASTPYSQRTKIDLQLQNSSLIEILNSIEKNSEFIFIYNQNVTNSDVRRSISVKSKNIESILDYLFKDLDITYRIDDRQVFLYKRNSLVAGNETPPDQPKKLIKGRVTDTKGNPIPGTTVIIKGTTIGTVTDNDGNFALQIPVDSQTLFFSFVGYATQEIPVDKRTQFNIVLKELTVGVDEVVIVGYGQQKKESIVAAITQTTGQVLERAGGVSSVGAALTGNVPGVITSSSTGMPGEEDPEILIRGQSTWNDSSPLILVDGVERPMSSVDISSVESISVLKDASATAVFGVRGANGVILITTKRGSEGKASIRVAVNTTMKVPSKLPTKYDSYNSLKILDEAIEYELSLSPDSWEDYIPAEILEKYRNPSSTEEAEQYPNIDWVDWLFKDFVMSYNANISIDGGTKYVKYFTSADFLHEGDLFKEYENNRGYKAGYGYNRLNVRSNLDFKLTPTTTFKTNFFGSYGRKKKPYGSSDSSYSYWIAAYTNSPDAYVPLYSDGTWGYYYPNEQANINSVESLALSGIEYVTTTRLTTDFTLEQDLGFWVKGLSLNGRISWDNVFVESGRGVNDLYNNAQEKYIDPETGEVTYSESYDSNTYFDYQESIDWDIEDGSIENSSTQRNLFYDLQLNYATSIAKKHNITAMGLFQRTENATGSEIPSYREDWVFRTTYNYKEKYMFEYSGAYNGSEKFSDANRFAFFQSGGLGYMISKENFMKPLTFLDMLKIRASYGEIGDDNVSDRWLYMSTWSYGGQTSMGTTGEDQEESPYIWYSESSIGNENVHWETVRKTNVGADFSFFNGFFAGSVDFFHDYRYDILVSGDDRTVPSYFGAEPATANLGKVKNNGYELDFRFNQKFANDLRLYANFSITHAKNTVIEADDADLLPDYQKTAGHSIGQTYAYVIGQDKYYNTWDELYGSTELSTNDDQKLPGGYYIVDYNGDGVINSDDEIPYGYSTTPQNTYNATLGFEWKGFSGFVQFYGVNNVTRQVVFSSLDGTHTVYDEGSYWSEDNTDADVAMLRWLSTESDYSSGTRYLFDGSYLRLKNAEIAYTFNTNWGWVKKARLENVRLFLNGNNLWLWTKMPDDRESNFAGTGWASQGAYPTMKRFNLGLNITF